MKSCPHCQPSIIPVSTQPVTILSVKVVSEDDVVRATDLIKSGQALILDFRQLAFESPNRPRSPYLPSASMDRRRVMDYLSGVASSAGFEMFRVSDFVHLAAKCHLVDSTEGETPAGLSLLRLKMSAFSDCKAWPELASRLGSTVVVLDAKKADLDFRQRAIDFLRGILAGQGLGGPLQCGDQYVFCGRGVRLLEPAE